MAEEKRRIVIPGETIVSGESYLPGDGSYRDGGDVVASKFGLSDVSEKLVKVIPLSGVYHARRGNAIIGQIVDITHNGWIMNIRSSQNGFLPVAEVPRFVKQEEMRENFDFGDVVLAKVWNINARGIDLSVKMRGFGKLREGMLMEINPNKVPRVIGKEGSMVNIIKDATGCNITVGQNGWIWIKGDEIEDELNAKKIIGFICDNSFIDGLTEKVQEFVKKEIGNGKKTVKEDEE